MLGNEDRMIPPRRLSSVIDRGGGRQSCLDEVGGVSENQIKASPLKVGAFLFIQAAARPKFRITQRGEQIICLTHI